MCGHLQFGASLGCVTMHVPCYVYRTLEVSMRRLRIAMVHVWCGASLRIEAIEGTRSFGTSSLRVEEHVPRGFKSAWNTCREALNLYEYIVVWLEAI